MTLAVPVAVDDVAGAVRRTLDTADGRPVSVAIDGVDGVGKTTFANLVAASLRGTGVRSIRISIDDFHHVREHRYRRGRTYPVGYFEDSFDHDAFVRLVLDPLMPGGSGSIRTKCHDLETDELVDEPPVEVLAGDVVLVDGVFLQSPRLASRWDLVVFLDAPFEVTVPRAIERDGAHGRHGLDDARALAAERYVPGQRMYLDGHEPRNRADLVVDATDWARARIIVDRRGRRVAHQEMSPCSE